MEKYKNLVSVYKTFKNLLHQNCSEEFLDILSPWLCLINVCSNGGTTYIVGKIIAKKINVCSNGGTTYIVGKIIAKNNLNIDNLMQNR